MKNKKNKKPILIGLTGSLAMGKSTATKMLAALGAIVFCADKAVHEIIKENKEAQNKIIKSFPESLWAGKISRKRLGNLVFRRNCEIKKLEKILHPYVKEEMLCFIKKNKKKEVILFDIPLLFEENWDKKCDITMCVYAPLSIQKERALKRKNMTSQKLKEILKQQMSSLEKCKRADFVVSSGNGKDKMHKDILNIWEQINA